MHSSAVLDLFRESGALLEGHFKLSSGLHSGGYLQCALVLQWPTRAEALGRGVAELVQSSAPTVVLSPAMGGLIIGHEVARALGVRSIFSERVDGVMTLRRGFSLQSGDRVVVIEDVVTTGRSTKETMVVTEGTGARVVAAGAIIDRSGGNFNIGVTLNALAVLTLPTFDPTTCPKCAAGEPVVKPGSRA